METQHATLGAAAAHPAPTSSVPEGTRTLVSAPTDPNALSAADSLPPTPSQAATSAAAASHILAQQTAEFLKVQRGPHGEIIFPDGPSVLYAAGVYLNNNQSGNPAQAAEPIASAGSPPRVISPHQLTMSVPQTAYKLEGGLPASIPIQYGQLLVPNDNTQHQQHTTPGPVRKNNNTRRRSKPYDTPGSDPTGVNGQPSQNGLETTSNEGGDNHHGDDDMAVKRRRNTEAARRSRERKAVKMQTLENQVLHLESVNASMATQLAVVEKERAIFAAREAEYNRRIATLESSLREAHDALMARAVMGEAKPLPVTTPPNTAASPTAAEQ
ncbi:uncharacterized protein EV422DRAFT_525596 [Fimicolochytrium jonesii]|uniref:uncharacterized protein n=1 Tax=Fimicolochytrium jonesii TaxID=1396493 RepID=UPI0022FEE47B|nr:uncharacterized protein EV422DRAFT_525596 [Fimicolochytrium jonesii]KAI8822083.1 hypothetical protein EV422DRAFT_525596 [Fimicolochytrium jonesii]